MRRTRRISMADSVDDPHIILDSIATRIVALKLSTPAVLFLEMNKPLLGLANAACQMAHPFLVAIAGQTRANTLQQILESRENVEALISLIEEKSRGPDPITKDGA